MNKSRLVEVTVTAVFIGSILLYLLFGLWHFAGFKYASAINKFILTILSINIYLGLLYFIYRFLRWITKLIKRPSK